MHVVLPLHESVGPLRRPLGPGARALRENHAEALFSLAWK